VPTPLINAALASNRDVLIVSSLKPDPRALTNALISDCRVISGARFVYISALPEVYPSSQHPRRWNLPKINGLCYLSNIITRESCKRRHFSEIPSEKLWLLYFTEKNRERLLTHRPQTNVDE
jgi:hypothetical protein